MLTSQLQMHAFKDEITARRNAVAKHWPAFLADHSRLAISEVIARSKTYLPDHFVPWALGVVIPSAYLLAQVGKHTGGWECPRPGVYTKAMGTNRLFVRSCGNFWTIEQETGETLVYTFGSLPVVTRLPDEAKQLAEYCYLHLPQNETEPWPKTLRGLAHGLRWVVSTPSGIQWC
jgi:hypothetical protein